MVGEPGNRDVSEQSASRVGGLVLPDFLRELATRRECFSNDTVVAMTTGTSHSFLVTDTLGRTLIDWRGGMTRQTHKPCVGRCLQPT